MSQKDESVISQPDPGVAEDGDAESLGHGQPSSVV
jgi:hypothetical protein